MYKSSTRPSRQTQILTILRIAPCSAEKIAKELDTTADNVSTIVQNLRNRGYDIPAIGIAGNYRYKLISEPIFSDTNASAAEEAHRYQRRNEGLT